MNVIDISHLELDDKNIGKSDLVIFDLDAGEDGRSDGRDERRLRRNR